MNLHYYTELRGKISAAEVAVPVASRLSPAQGRVALDVASVGLAPVADQHDVPVLGLVAVVAHPVQVLLLRWLVLELLALDQVLLALAPEAGDLAAAVGALAGVLQPLLQTLVAEPVLAVQVHAVGYLAEANCALVLFKFPQLPQLLGLRALH